MMHCYIRTALQQTHPADLNIIRHYIAWVKFRRRIHYAFYATPAHWLQSSRKVHWI